ncbi:MAG: hypothetical protein KatS3mg027_2504 [Bacteroidia bacterium]|nr:MAG: hypothetical protein KatS3mg027_2504 [Bacteroidia bacterium]
MQIAIPEYSSNTNNINPNQINYYHFYTLYDTITLIDEFIITTQIFNFVISTQKKYLCEITFFGGIDAQANTNSVAGFDIFGYPFIRIRAYEPFVPLNINKMQIVITPTDPNNPVKYIINPIQFRILGVGTILMTPINV